MRPRYSGIGLLVPGGPSALSPEHGQVPSNNTAHFADGDMFEDASEAAAFVQLEEDLEHTTSFLLGLNPFSPPTPRRGQPLGGRPLPFPRTLGLPGMREVSLGGPSPVCLITPPASPKEENTAEEGTQERSEKEGKEDLEEEEVVSEV